MTATTVPESFYMYLWRSPNLPGTLYVAQGFEATEELYKSLLESGFIVRLIHTATNAEFGLHAGRLCPSTRSITLELPGGGRTRGPLDQALLPIRSWFTENVLNLRASVTHGVGLQAARLVAKVVPKRILCSPRFFQVWERQGYHIVPLYYESPIPQPSELQESLWYEPSPMPAIDLRDAAQLNLLAAFQARFKSEYDAFPRDASSGTVRFHLNNGWFEKVDAEVLYSVVRHFRPSRIIEIGSGVSTMLAAQAIRENRKEDPHYECEFTAIEPSPVRIHPGALPPRFRLIEQRVQQVPLATFAQLGENDILFIDSSHVCRTGSDVNYEILQILPLLQKGVLVHFHDIFLPWEYPRSWVLGARRFLSEQYMLQAFLACNPDFEVLWGSHYMLHENPEALDAAFATFRQDITAPGTFLPGSFWIRRVAANSRNPRL